GFQTQLRHADRSVKLPRREPLRTHPENDHIPVLPFSQGREMSPPDTPVHNADTISEDPHLMTSGGKAPRRHDQGGLIAAKTIAIKVVRLHAQVAGMHDVNLHYDPAG